MLTAPRHLLPGKARFHNDHVMSRRIMSSMFRCSIIKTSGNCAFSFWITAKKHMFYVGIIQCLVQFESKDL